MIDGLVVADARDAREAKRITRLVPRRLLNPVERDLENNAWLDHVNRPVTRGGRRLEVLRELIDLDVRQPRIRFADVDELLIATHCECVIGQHAAPLPVSVLGGRDDAIERRQRLLVLQPRLPSAAGRVDRPRILDDQPFVRPRACGIEKFIDMCRIANRRLIRGSNRVTANDVSKTRQAFAQRQFKKRLAVFEEEIECEERDRRLAQQRFRDFTAAEAGLNDGEGENAVAECHDLAVEDDTAIELPRCRFDLGKSMRDVVHRPRVNPHFLAIAVQLRADAVVFIVRERANAQCRDDLLRIFFGLRKHERKRMKKRHLHAFQRVAFREQGRRADVTGEHVGSTHGIGFSSERLRDRRLDETFLQSDAKLADEDLHDVARALSVNFSQQLG